MLKERSSALPVPPAFGNVEYIKRITYTLSTDRRTMSFVDYLWGFEITGGSDQFEPLTIINVSVIPADVVNLDWTTKLLLKLFFN